MTGFARRDVLMAGIMGAVASPLVARTDIPPSLDVLARRKGDNWYLGAMTDAAQTIAVPLGFLGKRRYVARTWQDGATPTDLATASRTVGTTDSLALTLAASGGAVAVLAPVR